MQLILISNTPEPTFHLLLVANAGACVPESIMFSLLLSWHAWLEFLHQLLVLLVLLLTSMFHRCGQPYLQDDETYAIRDATNAAIRDTMHIINLSLGINTWVPEPADAEGIQKAAAAGILMAAAAGNEGEEAGLQSVIHPSWDPNVFSVAMLANTVTAGAAMLLSESVVVDGKATNRIGESTAQVVILILLMQDFIEQITMQ
jgi:hypothetical protein